MTPGAGQPAVLPQEVESLLDRLRAGTANALGENMIGLYPYGSLAIGDFDPASSDLDLVVACTSVLQPANTDLLKNMHAEMDHEPNPWVRRLEMWYVPLPILRAHGSTLPGSCLCWSTHHPMEEAEGAGPVETKLVSYDDLAEDWVLNRWTIRAGGHAFAGPSPRGLIDPIPPETIQSVVKRLLRNNWSQYLDDPAWMLPAKYQAFVVLTMCRALHALATGELVSKPRAAAWAIGSLDPRWIPLIQWALAHRADTAPSDLSATLAFLRFAVEHAR